MMIEIKTNVENLSSRKLWSIIHTNEKEIQQSLIAAAKSELTRREQLNSSASYCAPN